MAQKILIVDDESFIRKSLANFFNHFGYETQEAETGEEALAILADDPISMIFLDLNLPGVSGIEVCRRIRETGRPAIVYAVTGYHHVYSPEDCKKSGFDDFFVKPARLDELHSAVIRGFEKLEEAESR